MIRLKHLRKSRKLTQQRFADELGIERESVARYENGSRVPPLDKLIQIADYFDVSIDYLVGRSDQPHYISTVGDAVVVGTKKDPVMPEHDEAKEEYQFELNKTELPEQIKRYIDEQIRNKLKK